MTDRRTFLRAGFLALPYLLGGVEPAEAAPTKKVDVFAKAKKELPANFYLLYRIVERLSRANTLDSRPWRIQISPTYEINAFATEVNLLVLHTGILDQLANDVGAISFIVGHEMGHHIKRHIALGASQSATQTMLLRKEAEAEIKIELEKEEKAAQAAAEAKEKAETVKTILDQGCQLFGTCVSQPVKDTVTKGLLGSNGKRDSSKVEARINEIIERKKLELEQNGAEYNRKQEFEADAMGYLYTATAGYDPEGWIRAMQVLGRIEGAEFDTSHPAVPSRIDALKSLSLAKPASQLVPPGKARLASVAPLTYDLANDLKSLRVNSRFSARKGGDIDAQLDPQ